MNRIYRYHNHSQRIFTISTYGIHVWAAERQRVCSARRGLRHRLPADFGASRGRFTDVFFMEYHGVKHQTLLVKQCFYQCFHHIWKLIWTMVCSKKLSINGASYITIVNNPQFHNISPPSTRRRRPPWRWQDFAGYRLQSCSQHFPAWTASHLELGRLPRVCEGCDSLCVFAERTLILITYDNLKESEIIFYKISWYHPQGHTNPLPTLA